MLEAARRTGVAGFRAAGGTDTGRVRTGNEDRLHIDADRGIFVVVDGVGGHAAGEVAAAIAVDVITQRLERPLWSPEQRVREAIALANNEILTHAQASPEHNGMTCVLTLALLTERGLTIGHVGDTRLYKLTPAGIVKLTHDHSPVGEREDAREITEVEAMRHPRRNEVFRDVGSAFHEPDDPDFIEIVETTFDSRSAILICSDGLSDMLSSTAIERTVRQHAGTPARVVESLILAANEAGGKDNVTAVYVEGDDFAQALRALPDPGSTPAAALPAATAGAMGHGGFWKSRATWLGVGVLAGLALGIALAWALTLYAPVPTAAGRTLIVGAATPEPDSPDTFATIGGAMAAAGARDTVQIEPGEYEEAVVVKDGVNLVARVPGTVSLTGRPGQAGWVSVTADGRLGSRITGIRVLGSREAPISVGLRLTGHDLQVDDVTVEGTVGVGMDIVNDGSILVRASRLSDIDGLPLRVGPAARPVIQQNLFVHRTGARAAAAELAPDAEPNLQGNLFVGYPEVLKSPTPRQQQLVEDNFAIRGQSRAATPRGRTP
jgi:serine/threonine protein phosphatase PrpC